MNYFEIISEKNNLRKNIDELIGELILLII